MQLIVAISCLPLAIAVADSGQPTATPPIIALLEAWHTSLTSAGEGSLRVMELPRRKEMLKCVGERLRDVSGAYARHRTDRSDPTDRSEGHYR